MLEEETDVSVAEKTATGKEDTPMDNVESAIDDSAKVDINMQGTNNTDNGGGLENGELETEGKPVQMETETKVT